MSISKYALLTLCASALFTVTSPVLANTANMQCPDLSNATSVPPGWIKFPPGGQPIDDNGFMSATIMTSAISCVYKHSPAYTIPIQLQKIGNYCPATGSNFEYVSSQNTYQCKSSNPTDCTYVTKTTVGCLQ